jgi:hypothetical protein
MKSGRVPIISFVQTSDKLGVGDLGISRQRLSEWRGIRRCREGAATSIATGAPPLFCMSVYRALGSCSADANV